MERKLVKLWLSFLAGCALFSPVIAAADPLLEQTKQAGYSVPKKDLPAAAIVIEAENGQILWEQDAEKKIDPAELSNLMTIYLTLEAVKKGSFTMDTVVTATATHAAIAQLPELNNKPIIAGVAYSVRDLLQLTASTSSNVAAIMLSNLIAEQDSDFVGQMNAQAKKLGMTQTVFNTVSGIPASQFNAYYQPEGYELDASNQSTAKDLAILSYHLLRNHPEILTLTKESSFKVLPDSLYEETFKNNNLALPGKSFAVSGTDGLKISSSETFHSITTTRRKGMRVITVVLGVGKATQATSRRSLYAVNSTLIEKAFADYEYAEVLTAGEQFVNQQKVTVANDFYAVVKKGTTPELTIGQEFITLTDALPVIAKTTFPLAVSYTEDLSESKLRPVLLFLLESIRVTKLTIIALGWLVMGALFSVVALFIPRQEEEDTRQIVLYAGLGLVGLSLVTLFLQYLF